MSEIDMFQNIAIQAARQWYHNSVSDGSPCPRYLQEMWVDGKVDMSWRAHAWVVEAVKSAYLLGQATNPKFRERVAQMSDSVWWAEFGDEADSFLVEGAVQHGFEIADDDATVLLVHEADFVSFVRMAQKHAVEKALADFKNQKKIEGEKSLPVVENSSVSEKPWPFSPVVKLLRSLANGYVELPNGETVLTTHPSNAEAAQQILDSIPQTLPGTAQHAIAATIMHKAMEFAVATAFAQRGPEVAAHEEAARVKAELQELVNASVLPLDDARADYLISQAEAYYEGSQTAVVRNTVATILENHQRIVHQWKGRAEGDEVVQITIDLDATRTIWDRVTLETKIYDVRQEVPGEPWRKEVLYTLTRKEKTNG